MKINISGYILLSLILFISIKIYLDSDNFNLKCINSTIDGNKYCVRERSKITLAVDKLAIVTQKLKKLVSHLGDTYPERSNVKRLVTGFNPTKIVETLPSSEYTAYSENKGDKIAFCLDTEKGSGNLIDDNTLTFVGLHEIAHIATESVGHTNEFWTNFKFLLQEASKIKIYTPEDYKKKNKKYCGMELTDNPYFDL
jgi:hypothetical protein